MPIISIQLQPKLDSRLNSNDVLKILNALGHDSKVSEGEDGVPYINVAFKVHNLSEQWPSLKSALCSCPGFNQAAIVVCEGSKGWDNYLLLHHFNQSEQIYLVPSNH